MIRIFVAAGLALVLSGLGTRLLIGWLTSHRVGQPIHEDVPEGHTTKAGTPTMGGIAIVFAAVASYVLSTLYRGIATQRGLIVVGAIAAAGFVGFLDDFIKVRNERNLGLNKRAKMIGLLTVAIGFAVLIVTQTQQHTTLSFTRHDSIGWELGKVGWVIWAVFLIAGFSNGANLTDGLDGLAAGAGIFAFSAFVIVGFWAFKHPGLYDLRAGEQGVGLDLAVIAAAMVGALAGFLWYNAAPARIFMGDTGSLAIGTGLACLALTTNTALLLPIIGALFVAETMSVILQVASFRLFGGRRIFRMAPIHHHFELCGWPETRVIVRFWMMSAMCTAAGVGIFYRDFLVITGTLA
ncbi:MAG: phospho-N-acetylmuramoyl-pentapeptide-transferase [Microthrixaceae bacterium]|nr:phospho-N-acetylmuramoyl-pentapeptide-transferase [Actinomycetota bacterium]MBP6728678.1 phospho-N-acetylmuramoyl-pentapeptide-transferase [Microthrixaceae bacterium]HMS12254.1 phospho-N-acetylmuramoyl-pentapeptide-transferase [Microthrixaceae bacterium]HMT23763.1 phospho-N-acetylmuramoyl-pentapeptide-transferase [Microthrixaceae bacterium]HMT61174.1 phospho-N-acetylmuramoyl-pentapeptide-transferase [Microthrixaceae bacterium]